MARLTITRLDTGSRPSSYAGHHPKARLRAGDRELVLPFAPREAGLSGWGRTWGRVDRPGRKPLVLADGEGLEGLSHTYLVGALDHQVSVEPILAELRRLANDGERVTLVNLSPLERGPWRIESVAVTATMRQHGTNVITRAEVAVTYVEAADVSKLGPLSGGKDTGKGITKARNYELKAGDTLRKLAVRFYGEPDEWKRIAKANKIKDPAKLKAGRVIRIPADDKKD